MSTHQCAIPNISCGHCAMRIEKALRGLDGVTAVKADIPTKSVKVDWDEAVTNWEAIAATLEKIGYPPQG